MLVIFTFIFCKWLVCCLTGFYQPNRDDDDDDDDDDDETIRACGVRESQWSDSFDG